MGALMTTSTEGPSKRTALVSWIGVDHRHIYKGALSDYVVTPAPDQLAFLPGAVLSLQPDILIVDCDELKDAINLVLEKVLSSHALPILVFAEKANPGALEASLNLGVASCVVGGLAQERINVLVTVAVQRFKVIDGLRQELARTKDMLEARKFIERAKGVLMNQRGLKEDEAYDLMRRNAMSQNKTIREVAENILLFSGLIG